MDQSARLVWYHDHAYGITRINAYAGVASALVIRDQFEGRSGGQIDGSPGVYRNQRPGRQASGGTPPRLPGQGLCGQHLHRHAATPPGPPWPARMSSPRGPCGTPMFTRPCTVETLTGGKFVLAAQPFGGRGVLRRHHAGQRHGLSHRPGGSPPVPAAPVERLQRPVSEPAALPGGRHPRHGITLRPERRWCPSAQRCRIPGKGPNRW